MKANKIIDTTKKFISSVNTSMAKNSPTILIFAGAVGVVAGVVLAVKAGKVVDEKTQAAKDDLKEVHSKKKDVDQEIDVTDEDGKVAKATYTKVDYAKELTQSYGRLIFAYAKVFGPAAVTTLFSLFLIFTSHNILTKRYAITYASLATMTKAYDSYRKNVIEAEGPEADEKYRFGIKTIEEEVPVFDKDGNPKLDKNGNPKKIKTTKEVIDEDIIDPRSVLWDEVTAFGTYDNVTADEEIRWRNNANAVMQAQKAANAIMEARSHDPRNNGIGYIYLNEVLNMLGMKPVDVGQTFGWRYDPRLDISNKKYDPYYHAPEDWGDNRVDFGLNNPDIPGYEARRRFLSGHEDAILLFMNFDGIINDKVGLKTIFSKKEK